MPCFNRVCNKIYDWRVRNRRQLYDFPQQAKYCLMARGEGITWLIPILWQRKYLLQRCALMLADHTQSFHQKT
jgi:hypothetical protein